MKTNTHVFICTFVVDVCYEKSLSDSKHADLIVSRNCDSFQSCVSTVEDNLENMKNISSKFVEIDDSEIPTYYHYIVKHNECSLSFDFRFNLVVSIHEGVENCCRTTMTVNNKFYNCWEDAVLDEILPYVKSRLDSVVC